MLLLKNETADLNQKINSVDKKAFVSHASGKFYTFTDEIGDFKRC